VVGDPEQGPLSGKPVAGPVVRYPHMERRSRNHTTAEGQASDSLRQEGVDLGASSIVYVRPAALGGLDRDTDVRLGATATLKGVNTRFHFVVSAAARTVGGPLMATLRRDTRTQMGCDV
jgi:hypothetical protein